MTDLILPAGAGRKLITPAQEVTFKATKEMGSSVSIFEVIVPPGFDVGAHVHEKGQEFFYVLQGELDLLCFEPARRTGDSWHNWTSAQGDRVIRAGEGSCMFVPPGTPHAFRNATDKPVKMLFQSLPSPDHEDYFEEIAEIWSRGTAVDPAAVAEMRKRYDVSQLTPLRYEPPAPRVPGQKIPAKQSGR
ncbi:cupin domain-containing protein [Streptomyces sp. IB201691-2A2]|jgi:mannose-6-phosphate isomerase-like protein (cupin superfamily)|uniref:cupin domain-containing protein n=1 Tax=Streptomyces sp. IB201691-2A2 TaxID=2561920 RepID=UPI00117C3B86|nr:cupin domain-containing protein [Streptomyces sp. IB201691-2A2]TRO56472.1 cupin domain-containing protein [Streptomyces sp. IB201691-2A2]